MSSDYKVATGSWNNYSNHGGWLAASLTVNVQTGSLLIAAAATFITIVGSRFWSILSFAIHQIRARQGDRDGVHHQHQVIYKNSTQLGTVWLLTRVVWAWKGVAARNFPRYVLFSLPPLICFAAFTVASIFSSRIAAPTYAASEVRVVPNNCGFITYTPPTSEKYDIQAGSAFWAKYSTQKTRESTDYARTCYGKSAASCRIFPVKELPYSVNITAKCPFGGDRCVLGDDGAFELTTRWLDSHKDLGINAPPQNRIHFRKVVTCSVLNIDDLITVEPSPSGLMDRYYYNLGSRGFSGENGGTNWTYSWRESSRTETIPYSLAADKAVIFDPYRSIGWDPMDDLNRTDADVSIFFLNSNGMRYLEPVLDPFFRATRKYPLPSAISNASYSGADNITSTLACTDQFQIQNPNTNTATELTSSLKAQTQALGIGLNNAQFAAVLRLSLSSYESLIWNSVNGFSAGALHAPDIAYQTLSLGLPEDQWRTEVTGWFNTSLATLQDRIVSFASKDLVGIDEIGSLYVPSIMPELLDMCHNQIIKNVGQYQSFSLFGVVIIFVVGSFIILLSWILEPLVGLFRKTLGRRGGRGEAKQDQWLLASSLQLQRLALQKDGLGGEWTKLDGEVPVTRFDSRWSHKSEG